MAGRPRISELERFMSHVHKDDSGCWIWSAYCMKNGYGLFRNLKKHDLAHRVAYRLFNGLLDNRDVMHKCDVRNCVNPEHLSLGTRLENMQDAKAKGRVCFGERHGRSKLTNEQVDLIKKSDKFQKEIALEFGISQSHVSCLKRGSKWQNKSVNWV
jgi:predicted XRE-type DNA-binding protein